MPIVIEMPGRRAKVWEGASSPYWAFRLPAEVGLVDGTALDIAIMRA
jgi:hypothetical protein